MNCGDCKLYKNDCNGIAVFSLSCVFVQAKSSNVSYLLECAILYTGLDISAILQPLLVTVFIFIFTKKKN